MYDYDNSFCICGRNASVAADLSWDCTVAAQEERDEEMQEQVSMTEAGCFGFFGHEGP